MFLALGIWCFWDAYVEQQHGAPEAWTLEHINDIAGHVLNHYGPFVFGPVAALFIVWAVLALRRRIEADDEGISVNRAAKIAWSEFTGIDAAKLQSKGILFLLRGQERLKLDSYQYRNFRELAALIETKVPGQGG